MPSRAPLLLLLALLAGCAAPAPAADEPPPTDPPAIEGPILVDAGGPGGEPMLARAPDGTLYLQAVSSPRDGGPESAAWRSYDNGRTWTALPIPDAAARASYDGAVAVGPAGEVYLANAENAVLRIWRSDDRGDTWEALSIPAVAPAHRMWLVPSDGRLDVGIDTLGGPNFHFVVDGGGPTIVSPTYGVGGALARRGADGLLLWPRHEAVPEDRYLSYRSADGGASWTSAPITPGTPPETYPIGEARRTSLWTPAVFDANGTAYHAWSAEGAVLLSRSLDGGATWSPAVALTREDENALLPWMTDALDVVAVVANGTSWQPLAMRLSWPPEAEAPEIRRVLLPGTLHEGPICTYGQGCPFDERALGDFVAALTLPDGRLVAAFGSSVDATAYRAAPVVYRVPPGAFGDTV